MMVMMMMINPASGWASYRLQVASSMCIRAAPFWYIFEFILTIYMGGLSSNELSEVVMMMMVTYPASCWASSRLHVASSVCIREATFWYIFEFNLSSITPWSSKSLYIFW